MSKRLSQLVCVRITAGPSAPGTSAVPIVRRSRAHQIAPGLLSEPVPVVRRDQYAVGGEDRQPIRDRTRWGAKLALKVGERFTRRTPRPAARSPTGCPSHSWSGGIGRPAGHPRSGDVSRPPAWTATTIRSDPTVRQRLCRRPSRRKTADQQRSEVSAADLVPHVRQPLRVVGHPVTFPFPNRQQHRPQRSAARGHQVFGPGRIRLVNAAVEEAITCERLQAASEHRIRDRQPYLEFGEPRRAQQSLLHDKQRPFVAEQPEHPGDGIGLRLLHLQADCCRGGVGIVPAPQL